MAEKRINGRIVLKHDIESNWILATGFTPMAGEIIIYDIDDNYDYERLKIGDGVQNVNSLPFYAGSWEDLSDRPFGVETILSRTVVHEKTINNTDGVLNSRSINYDISNLEDKNVIVTVNGTEYDSVCEWDGTKGGYRITLGNDEYDIYQSVTADSAYISTLDAIIYDIKIETVDATETVITLDENFIPDTIARVSDVDEVKTLVGDTSVSEQINTAAVNNQSDWSVNDVNSPSYIKNRLFYKADPTNIELINGAFTSTQAGETLYMMQIGAIDVDIVDGQECNIVFDSDTYDVTAKTIQYNDTLSYLIAGNAYVLSSIFGPSVENTGEPFCIIFASGNVICYTNNTSTEHTVVIGTYMAQTITIPHEYLGLNVGNGEGVSSVQEGNGTSASGNAAHAEGAYTVASGVASHAEGQQTNASGNCAHAEGASTTASGAYSHAEGRGTEASTAYAHAEGYQSEASGEYGSHAEGYITTASGDGAHAEGGQTVASGAYSHAEGSHTIAAGEHQHVEGKYNIEDTSNQYAHIVGNGSKNGPVRSNAHTLDWSGNAWYSGDVYVGSTNGKNKDDGSKKLATEDYVNELVGDTAVSEQISSAINEATADDFGIYVQAQEPTDAVAGDIWIDTANDPSYIPPTLPEITAADNGKVLMVVNGKLQLVNLNLSVDANGVVSM